MNRHFSRRALTAVALSSVLLVGLLPGFALGVPIPAHAALVPVRQFVGDSTGRLLTFRVRNSGTPQGIGSVRISPPSPFWTVTTCPSAPTGWTRSLAFGACEYSSAPGAAGNIPQGQGRYFKLRATTAPSDHNVWGTWAVEVSPDEDLAPIENVEDAAPMGLGLRLRAFTFEVVDAVISDSPATAGDPCPAADKTADAGSTGNYVVVCGRNHGNATLTPVNTYSKLLGSMIASHGSFTGGPIPASDNVVVLGNWSNVTVTSHDGPGKAMRMRVGSSGNAISPVRRIAGFTATDVVAPPLNVAPALDAGQNVSMTLTSEDPGSPSGPGGTAVFSLVDYTPPVGGTDNVSDPDGPGLGVAIVGGTSAGTLWYSTDNGTTWTNGGAPSSFSDSNALLLATGSGSTTGRVYYQPAANVTGVIDPVITFRAWDQSTGTNGTTAVIGSTGGSSAVSTNTDNADIAITPANDAPTATNASFSMDENTTRLYAAPGALDDADDIDGDSLEAVLVTGPAHAAIFSLNTDGSFTYRPVANYVGDDSFTWKAKDPSGAESNMVTVSITVYNVGGGGGGGCLISC